MKSEKKHVVTKEELEKLNQPYYLKIWLHEKNIGLLQVVCAIGDKIEKYENMFLEADYKINIKNSCYKNYTETLTNFLYKMKIAEFPKWKNEFYRENLDSELEYSESKNGYLKNLKNHIEFTNIK